MLIFVNRDSTMTRIGRCISRILRSWRIFGWIGVIILLDWDMLLEGREPLPFSFEVSVEWRGLGSSTRMLS